MIQNKTTKTAIFALATIVATSTIVHSENRSFDGLGNNLTQPTWGAAGDQFARIAAPAYADGVSAPAGAARTNPRIISNALCTSAGDEPNPYQLSDFVWQWGQFLDHDITLSFTNSSDPFHVVVGAGDLLEGIIPLNRTIYDPATGVSTPREQINSVTSFVDGSMVYGSDGIRAAALRTFSGGHLKMDAAGLMPMNTTGLPNANDIGLTPTDLFLGGDVRSNEQLGLTSMHTIFVREHNRLADIISAANPTWDDYQIYQRARKIVGAYIQAITYNEFLPAMLGNMAPDSSTFVYDPGVRTAIANEFSAALFRIGHTMVSDQLLMMLDDGQPASTPQIEVLNAFFSPSTLINDPQKIDWILKGLSMQTQQQVDTFVVDDLRNQLFGPAGFGGLDLASLNIQRGRDHGLASYNDTREAYGLSRKNSINDITSNPAMQSALATVYSDVDDIDLWIGGLAENHMPTVPVGELMAVSFREQFTNLAVGDRFFYLFDPDLADKISEINSTTLADIIMRNSGIISMTRDIFHVAPSASQVAMMHDAKVTISFSSTTIHLEMSGADPDQTYTLERSQDTVDWQPVVSDIEVVSGKITATDTKGDQMFYRFKMQ
jgi:peroxidase